LGGGVSQVTGQVAAAAKVRVIAKPSTTSANAPAINAIKGQVVVPVVKSLPKSVIIKAMIIIGQKSVSLGSIKTNSIGTATLPAIRASNPGTYRIQLTSSTGSKFFLKLIFKAK
jgi:hypothetical protein